LTTYSYSTFLSLTNRCLIHLNEVPLTLSNFASAVGFQAVAADAVNLAVRDINSQKYEWPFNHIYTTQILTPGVPIYSLPNNCKYVEWDSFSVDSDQVLTNPQNQAYTPYMDYKEYLQKYQANDANAWILDTQGGPPKNIFRTNNMEFGVTPYPDQAYTMSYEYWQIPTDMVNATDICTVPNLFDFVIFQGAMKYCYRFRENLEASADAKKAFDDGCDYMRTIYISNFQYVRDNRAGPQFNMRG
jgi:hypothetical protein